MVFLAASAIAVLLQLTVPLLLVGAARFALRGTEVVRHGGVGLPGALTGAGLFVLAMAVKLALRRAGIASLWGDGFSGAPLAITAIGTGAFAGIVEEVIRFGAAVVLFGAVLAPHAGNGRWSGATAGEVRTPRLLAVSVLFGLGWGGIESVITGLTALTETLRVMEANGGSFDAVPLPLFPLLGAVERTSAMAFHVGVTVWAARAAFDLHRGRLGRFAALLGGAILLHAVLDAIVHAYAVPGRRALAHGDYARGLHDFLMLEIWFAGGALLALWVARTLDRRTVSSSRTEAASPGS